MITHINDRKLSEYPFFNIGQAPFPPGCITYLGVCIKGEPNGQSLYASAILISERGVLVSLCRDVQGSTAGEVIGSVYASVSTGTMTTELSGGSVKGSVSMVIDNTMLRDAYGSYSGKFYLDPSCVTYMSDAVQGSLKEIRINGETFSASQSLNFSTMGDVIEFSVVGHTAYLRGTDDVDNYNLVDEKQDTSSKVTTINELSTTDMPDDYPEITLIAQSPVQITVVRGGTENPADLVLDIVGGTDFPHCYSSKDESEMTYAANNEQP